MSVDFELRAAVESDVAEIARIYNHAIEHTTATFDTEPKTLDDRLAWFRERTDDYPVIVATVGGKVAGWAEIKPVGTRKAYRYTVENAIYVDTEYQGKGIGSALLARLIEIAEEKGFHVILALIVSGNESSVGLHVKHGFEHVGTEREVGWKFGKWLDVLIFERLLDPL
jgi:L-amino acid N-acyltransferase YncA